jgi:hypothetical protein
MEPNGTQGIESPLEHDEAQEASDLMERMARQMLKHSELIHTLAQRHVNLSARVQLLEAKDRGEQ